MKTLFALTKNTFRETIRDRILLLIAFFGIILLLSSLLLSSLSARQDSKIIVDLGMGLLDMFGLLITIFVGTQLIFREVDQKTIFLVLSKPVSRADFLLSKFFGLGAILTLITGIMFVVFLVLLVFSTDLIVDADNTIHFGFLGQIFLIASFSLLSFLLLLSGVLFLSSFLSPMLAAFSALGLFVIGHLTDDMRIFAQDNTVSSFFRGVAEFSYFAFPNFSILNRKNFVLSDLSLSAFELFSAAGGATVWIVIFVLLGTLFFSRREF